ncbi:MAG: endonuclease MutS2 [Gemmatimonadaceae bacterium]
MNSGGHALTVLEFSRVLDLVAGHASSAPGAARTRELPVLNAAHDVVAEHARVEAMRAVIESEAGWNPEAIPDLGAALARLRVEGTAWTATELRAAVTLLISSRRALDGLRDKSLGEGVTVSLDALAAALVRDTATEREIDRVVAEDGVVRDDASPVLRRVRRELRGATADLVRMLERLMAKLDANHRVDDASVTMRNGRYVIPVRREGRGVVGGIVHDSSASGSTVFVEPPAAVEASNRIREMEAEELRETERVLLEATDRLRPHCDALVATLDALITLDSLCARARYAIAFGCAPAVVAAAAHGFSILDGRHPLLLARDRSSVVPFALTMEPGEHTLLVSGPNTGGKTVLLKALALISLMAQAGIPAPVGLGSRIPLYDRFFADIGDEQSIEASLSTFSAHLRNLTEIIHDATAQSLVLIDELGSGTDPLEGAALGGAILETLTRRGTMTVATTHLGALKELAHEVAGVVNASLQFDAVALAPTFRLVKGLPGRSYGLSIARRLAMPEEVLGNAERRVPKGERDVAALLEDLERRQQAIEAREKAADAHHDATVARAERVSEREQVVRERERELERAARSDARRYLLDARQEIEKTIRELRAAGAAEIEGAAVTARRAAERKAAEAGEALAALDEEETTEDRRPRTDDQSSMIEGRASAIEVGAPVAVATLGGKAGRVVEMRGRDAVVAVGAMKLTVPLRTLTRVSKRALEPLETAVPLIGDQPEVEVRHEVDLRGMRVDEMDVALVQAVDAAVRADLGALRIIHGKGTGALRERVGELLAGDSRVRTFRMGAWNEGGAGVTIAELA